jgi:hypothetical protein
LLKDLFSDTETKIIAERLGRSCSSVYCKSAALKLKRSPEFIAIQQKFFADTLRREGVKTRFKKGDVPHSKGKKREEFMSAEGIAKVKATQFKKNRVPHNWVPIGYERVSKDGYIEVKFTDNYGIHSVENFEFKHRLIWIENYGPIPPGMNVGFLDGDKRNFSVENLVLMDNAENLMKSCFSEKAIAKKMFKPKTDAELDLIMQKAGGLIKARQTQIKINKLIKDHGREN